MDRNAHIPLAEDPRLLDVRQRQAEAGAVVDRARTHRQALQRPRAEGVTELDRLEAEVPLPAAIVAEREADLAVLRLAEAAERTTRALVIGELRAALEPRLRAAVLAVQEAMERARHVEHRALLGLLDEVVRPTGDAHPASADLVWAPTLYAAAGSEGFVAFRRRALTERGWLDR